MLGRVKTVPINDGGLPYEPTPNYHCHVLDKVARPTDGAAEAQRRSQVCGRLFFQHPLSMVGTKFGWRLITTVPSFVFILCNLVIKLVLYVSGKPAW